MKDKKFENLKRYGIKHSLRVLGKRLGLKVNMKFQYPDTDIKAKVNFNYLGFLWEQLHFRETESNEFKFIRSKVQQGDVIFDIGAFIGTHSILFSNLVDDKGKVYCFEPDTKVFEILKNNIKMNKLNNVIIEKIGISNKSGESKLNLFKEGGKSLSSLLFTQKEQNPNYEIIKTSTLDDYCENNNIVPNGIKIDVEGAETLVIEGAQNLIEKYSPWIILEFHGHFMSEKERISNWNFITKEANKILFVEGESSKYSYGMEIHDTLDCEKGVLVYIEY